MMEIILFKWALAAYLISTLGYVSSLLVQRVWVARVSMWMLFCAFLIHTLTFPVDWLTNGFHSFLGLNGTLSFFAWVMCGIYLALQIKTKTRVLGAFVSPVVFLIMIAASAGLGGDAFLSSGLRGNLVMIHVALAVAGEALFALAAVSGAMYLLQDYLIKHKKFRSFSRFLPSLRDLDRINHLCLLGGFPLLTLGVLIGSIWARATWGSHWQWDPKQVWTLLAWVIFALLLHQRLAIGWKGHKAAYLSVLAFIFLLVSYGIEKMFFTTIHSFI